MALKNVEIKARCTSPDKIRAILNAHDAVFKGTDHQTDTYFATDAGRLKLREGTIENNLIFYQRPDTPAPRQSDIHLVPVKETDAMKALLKAALEVKITVEKKREIYFIDNVKFHIDRVDELGSFVEIEAIDEDGSIGEDKLREQCQHYLDLFGIEEDELIAESYSDLLLDL